MSRAKITPHKGTVEEAFYVSFAANQWAPSDMRGGRGRGERDKSASEH